MCGLWQCPRLSTGLQWHIQQTWRCTKVKTCRLCTISCEVVDIHSRWGHQGFSPAGWSLGLALAVFGSFSTAQLRNLQVVPIHCFKIAQTSEALLGKSSDVGLDRAFVKVSPRLLSPPHDFQVLAERLRSWLQSKGLAC